MELCFMGEGVGVGKEGTNTFLETGGKVVKGWGWRVLCAYQKLKH